MLKFTMSFKPSTIEHLGLKLYGSLPPVIGELVSNAYDADADWVEVTLPDGKVTTDSEVIVRDYGLGMDAEALQNAYLPIGRNCRDELGRDFSQKYKRPLMGRKGVGKLSAFGIASILEIRTIKDGQAICILLDYEEMKKWPENKPYEPKIISAKTGPTNDKDGTEVRIKKLYRTKSIEHEWVKRELARRFTIIDKKFKTIINTEEIKPEDRRLKKDCKYTWDVSEVPLGNIVDQQNSWEVRGWFGLVEKSSQADRGVDIFARGKAVELETMFGLKTTHIQFARAYAVGEVHADFLDAEDDNVSTGRNMAHWESPEGQRLQDWGKDSLKFVFDQWLKSQKNEKEKKILEISGFEDWLKTRTPREQKIAKKLVKAMVEDEKIESDAAEPYLQVIKSNIEFQAFQELVDDIEESGSSVSTLLKLFSEWRIVEAREHLKLADGRLDIMEKLDLYIHSDALEVQQVQPLFEQNGWLVNPKWGEVTGQNTYSQLLRKNCMEPKNTDEKDRRMDILGYEVGGTVHIVELKRPKKTLSRKDLEQIESYVDWARAKFIQTGPDSPKHVTGLLIVGNINTKGEIAAKRNRLAGSDIRVETFSDLLHQTRKVYGEVEERLKKIAPEYSRSARKKQN